MRKQIIVLVVAVGLALTGGTIALAQTDLKPETPAAEKQGQLREKSLRQSGEKQGQPREKHGRGHGPGVGHAIHGELIVPVRPAEGRETTRPPPSRPSNSTGGRSSAPPTTS